MNDNNNNYFLSFFIKAIDESINLELNSMIYLANNDKFGIDRLQEYSLSILNRNFSSCLYICKTSLSFSINRYSISSSLWRWEIEFLVHSRLIYQYTRDSIKTFTRISRLTTRAPPLLLREITQLDIKLNSRARTQSSPSKL